MFTLIRNWLLFTMLLLALSACGRPAPVKGEPPPVPSQPTPTAAVVPTTEPTAELTPEPVSRERLCPEVPRPALVIYRPLEGEDVVTLLSPDGQQECQWRLAGSPRSQIASGGDSLFYLLDADDGSRTLWRLGPDGRNEPLTFTTIPPEEANGPFAFQVSADGQKIAWVHALATMRGEQTHLNHRMWVANLDGSEKALLFEGEVNSEQGQRLLQPLRFSPDNQRLFYAINPEGLGGSWQAFRGRYDNLHYITLDREESAQLFDCAAHGLFLCIGDFTADGELIAYSDPEAGRIQLVGADGQQRASVVPPYESYFGFPTFSPTGALAFTSAEVEDGEMVPLPNPGAISVLEPPYTGALQTLLNEPGIGTMARWVDSQQLSYYFINEDGGGMGVVTLDGRGWVMAAYVATVLP